MTTTTGKPPVNAAITHAQRALAHLIHADEIDTEPRAKTERIEHAQTDLREALSLITELLGK